MDGEDNPRTYRIDPEQEARARGGFRTIREHKIDAGCLPSRHGEQKKAQRAVPCGQIFLYNQI